MKEINRQSLLWNLYMEFNSQCLNRTIWKPTNIISEPKPYSARVKAMSRSVSTKGLIMVLLIHQFGNIKDRNFRIFPIYASWSIGGIPSPLVLP